MVETTLRRAPENDSRLLNIFLVEEGTNSYTYLSLKFLVNFDPKLKKKKKNLKIFIFC